MELTRGLPAQFFHGSNRLFNTGFRLEPQTDGYVHGSDVAEFERRVESRRPEGSISRLSCVFLICDCESIDAVGGYDDVVYLVRPLSEPERSDLAWYSEAWCEYATEPMDLAKVNKLIDRYWSGQQYLPSEYSVFEYRVHAAEVLEVVEFNVPIEDLDSTYADGFHGQ